MRIRTQRIFVIVLCAAAILISGFTGCNNDCRPHPLLGKLPCLAAKYIQHAKQIEDTMTILEKQGAYNRARDTGKKLDAYREQASLQLNRYIMNRHGIPIEFTQTTHRDLFHVTNVEIVGSRMMGRAFAFRVQVEIAVTMEARQPVDCELLVCKLMGDGNQTYQTSRFLVDGYRRKRLRKGQTVKFYGGSFASQFPGSPRLIIHSFN